MTLRSAVVVLSVGAAMLTACSAENSTSSTSTMSRASQSAEPTSDTRKTVETVETDDEALAELVGFTSPSGAISCMLDDDFVRCDVAEHTWNLPPRPADCEGDYGQGVSMAAGQSAEVVCAGDTTAGAGPPLAYGRSVTVGPLTCESAANGVTCRDAGSGRGFTVAREAYTVF